MPDEECYVDSDRLRPNIPFDEIYYSKPWQGKGGFYIDDKTIRPNEFLKLSYEEILSIVEPRGGDVS